MSVSLGGRYTGWCIPTYDCEVNGQLCSVDRFRLSIFAAVHSDGNNTETIFSFVSCNRKNPSLRVCYVKPPCKNSACSHASAVSWLHVDLFWISMEKISSSEENTLNSNYIKQKSLRFSKTKARIFKDGLARFSSNLPENIPANSKFNSVDRELPTVLVNCEGVYGNLNWVSTCISNWRCLSHNNITR